MRGYRLRTKPGVLLRTTCPPLGPLRRASQEASSPSRSVSARPKSPVDKPSGTRLAAPRSPSTSAWRTPPDPRADLWRLPVRLVDALVVDARRPDRLRPGPERLCAHGRPWRTTRRLPSSSSSSTGSCPTREELWRRPEAASCRVSRPPAWSCTQDRVRRRPRRRRGCARPARGQRARLRAPWNSPRALCQPRPTRLRPRGQTRRRARWRRQGASRRSSRRARGWDHRQVGGRHQLRVTWHRRSLRC